MIIAIDGPAGSGKSTIAKLLARHYNAVFMNTGSFYRALTLSLLEHAKKMQVPLDSLDEEFIIKKAKNLNIEYKSAVIFLDGKDVSHLLRSDEVEKEVSRISSIVMVRNEITKKIQKVCADLDIVSEGRDASTVIFPNADVKIYLDADIATRAKRRYDQGTSNLKLEEIESTIRARDELDKNKVQGSLKKQRMPFILIVHT